MDKLAAKLKDRGRPVVVMGDFNSDWSDAKNSPRLLAEKLSLKAFEPNAKTDVTTTGWGVSVDVLLPIHS